MQEKKEREIAMKMSSSLQELKQQIVQEERRKKEEENQVRKMEKVSIRRFTSLSLSLRTP
jgi:hypothetical protein